MKVNYADKKIHISLGSKIILIYIALFDNNSSLT